MYIIRIIYYHATCKCKFQMRNSFLFCSVCKTVSESWIFDKPYQRKQVREKRLVSLKILKFSQLTFYIWCFFVLTNFSPAIVCLLPFEKESVFVGNRIVYIINLKYTHRMFMSNLAEDYNIKNRDYGLLTVFKETGWIRNSHYSITKNEIN